MSVHLGAPVAILRSFNEAEAKDFYLRYLGFTLQWEHRFATDMPLYFEVRRDACILHISEHHGDATPGARLRIEVADVDALHGELGGRGDPRLRPGIEDQPWGARELTVMDPFANRLTFWSPLSANATHVGSGSGSGPA